MSHLGRIGAVVCAFGALLAGCVEGQGAQDLEDLEDVAEVRLMDKNASTGTNGLSGNDYFPNETLLIAAMNGPLVQSGSLDVSDDIEHGLLTTQAGANVFHYAVACAVPRKLELTWSQGSAMGRGHLAIGAAWLKGPLTWDVQLQVLACVVAHLNPYGLEVPLMLSGPHVKDDGENHTDYGVDEALWVVDENAYGALTYVVWPLKVVTLACGPDPWDALLDRLCGQSPGQCHFLLGDPADCVFDPGSDGFHCLGQPALMTTLRTPDLEIMYPGCF